jgi:hypothetical protein
LYVGRSRFIKGDDSDDVEINDYMDELSVKPVGKDEWFAGDSASTSRHGTNTVHVTSEDDSDQLGSF